MPDAAPRAAPEPVPPEGAGTAAAPAAVGPVSPWAPFAHPVFRRLWGVWLTANLCMWMNDVAAAWLMTSLNASPAWVAMVQAASTLPVFVLGLPSGALADIVDRRRYLVVTQLWIAAVATVTWLVLVSGAMTAPVLLALTFANGIGLAMRWPVFAALVPELVPRRELAAALALNGISMNASRIAGPILAGALIAGAGSEWVFALNAVLSIGASIVVLRWKRDVKVSPLPGERFVGAIRVGVQFVRQSQRMHAVLVRVALFFLQSTALLALLPLVATGLHGGGAGTFTLLLASMGGGAILAAAFMTRLRERHDRDWLVRWGTVLQSASMGVVAMAPNAWVAVPAMVLAGVSWISVANSLTVTAQLALPDWVRARGMALYQTALMGGAAFGAALWGQLANATSVRTAILAAAALGLVVVVAVGRRLRLEHPSDEDLTPQPLTTLPTTAEPIDPHDGPILVTIEYRIAAEDQPAFLALMRETRRARMRQGVLSWELFRDTVQPGRWVEYFVDESWVEHLRRFDRMTASDALLRERRQALHRGPGLPVVTRCLAQPLDAS